MKAKSWENVKQSAQFQLTSRFMTILTGVLLIVNLIFIGFSLYETYDYLVDQAEEVVTTLEAMPAESSDWEILTDAMVAKNEEDAVRIFLADGPTYYSAGGKAVFNELASGTALAFFNGIILAGDDIYYFHQESQNDRRIELAIKGDTVIAIVGNLLWTSFCLNLLAILIGSTFIYFFVGKWSKTLQQMSAEMAQIEHSEDKLLSVPKSPIEMYQVAASFNHLLTQERETIKREKRFIADASHELRTPLSAIRGHVQLIKRRGQDHPEVILSSIKFIDKESERLEKMTDQLLHLNRTANEKALAKVDFSEIVRLEVEKLQIKCSQKVTSSVAEKVFLWANKIELQQVCQNLLENAQKYSPDEAKIDVVLHNEKGKVIFKVTDTGPGIPAELKERIFERFFRGDDSRSSDVKGSGIGLAIVASIVEKYQGKVYVKDNRPTGSIFIVEFAQDEKNFMENSADFGSVDKEKR